MMVRAAERQKLERAQHTFGQNLPIEPRDINEIGLIRECALVCNSDQKLGAR